MRANTNRTKKIFRPVLSADEITKLETLVKADYIVHLSKPPYHPDHPLDNERGYNLIEENLLVSLMQKLAVQKAKIDSGAIKPAYVTTEKESILESLGAGPDELAAIADAFSKEDYWEKCYQKFVANPSTCTMEEINGAREHMYLNDLMTPAEKATFENAS